MPVSPKMVILGDMMELGEFAPSEHLEVIRQVLSISPDKILLIGKQFFQISDNTSIVSCLDTDAAIGWISTQSLSNFTILLKGSRKMQLERLIPYL
jgi:UDP-N-acetylmuramoyl-tripeptide--D-alanyl-D-alanine ligase